MSCVLFLAVVSTLAFALAVRGGPFNRWVVLQVYRELHTMNQFDVVHRRQIRWFKPTSSTLFHKFRPVCRASSPGQQMIPKTTFLQNLEDNSDF